MKEKDTFTAPMCNPAVRTTCERVRYRFEASISAGRETPNGRDSEMPKAQKLDFNFSAALLRNSRYL